MSNTKIFYLLLLLLLLLGITACTKRAKQPMQVIYDPDQTVEALLETPNITIDSLQTVELPSDVQQFYYNNNYKLGWAESLNRTQLIENLSELIYDGISINKETLEQLKKRNEQYDNLSEKDKIQIDFVFSTAYMQSISKLYNGSINPKKFYGDWEILPKPLNTSATMLLALENHSINVSFDSIRSKQPVYQSLRNKLTSLYQINDSVKIFIKAKLNDTIENLSTTKKHLAFLNLLPDSISIDNIYTSATATAIKQLQQKNAINPSGYIDTTTQKAIYDEEAFVKEKLIVNLERWRWFPRQFSKDYILVNIPAYSLISVANNNTIQKHKVVVGTIERKTPILSSTLSTVVINPTWTVPPTIKKNDLIPKATANRAYFSQHNFTIYDSQGKVISPEKWDPTKGGSYRYVQKGGNGNTLGRVKFLFKNDHAVYLHDTPSQWGFAKDNRSLSSGCVRVEQPFDLVNFIFTLLDNSMSKEKIDQVVASQETKNYSASKVPIDVYLLYWTVNVDNNGIMTFYKDVYNYDTRLYKQLQK